ncbi:MAG: MutS-related protein [Acidimicrobiales bacterium]
MAPTDRKTAHAGRREGEERMDAGGNGASPPAFGLLSAPGREIAFHDERDHASDLNIDQIVLAVTRDRDDADALEALLFRRTRDVETVHYRHEVFRDLDEPPVWGALGQFSTSVGDVVRHLSQARAMRVAEQRQGWTLDAAAIYCTAVRTLTDELSELQPRSRGLLDFRRYLVAYASSEQFGCLAREAAECKGALSGVSYCVNIDGGRVTVSRYTGERDYSEEIQSVFERFRQGAVRSYLVDYRLWPGMTRVGQQILGLVVRLFPEEFALLGGFFAGHESFFDPGVRRFYGELQFYVAYRALVDSIRAAGLPFCYPEVDSQSKQEIVEETFDLALAKKLVSEGGKVVTNDFCLDPDERIVVVSGPNQGGKTTFARTFGQLHHLAALGVPVPGRRAHLFLCDRIFTHFEREEDLSRLTGKLESDLLEMQRTLRSASAASVVVMNEVFSSTSLEDNRFLGAEAMRRLLELDCLGVYVTFVDELASLAPPVVSMVSTIVPGNPTERTFKVVRGPANGLAYALALAEKHRLTYPQLLARIP